MYMQESVYKFLKFRHLGETKKRGPYLTCNNIGVTSWEIPIINMYLMLLYSYRGSFDWIIGKIYMSSFNLALECLCVKATHPLCARLFLNILVYCYKMKQKNDTVLHKNRCFGVGMVRRRRTQTEQSMTSIKRRVLTLVALNISQSCSIAGKARTTTSANAS